MASLLQIEIEKNFDVFSQQWPNELSAAAGAMEAARKHFATSYLRISSIQAWRTSVLASTLDADSLAFFFEAQNDLLISHCLARCGSFRQSLKALRSAIENVFFSLYYKDHPVELQKWHLGKHKLGFAEMTGYFEAHPNLSGKSKERTGLGILAAEYSTLSKAVHGSAKIFRMTQNLIDIQLWSTDVVAASQWATREKAVVSGLNMLLLQIFHSEMQGGKNRPLREILGLVFPKTAHTAFKAELGITLIGP